MSPRLDQTDRHLADAIFKHILWNMTDFIMIRTLLKYISGWPIYNKPSLVEAMN